MTDKQPPRTAILPSDIDFQGNVTLWDHGPRELRLDRRDSEERAAARKAAHDAAVKAWHDEHGDMAQPLIVHSGDASHAIQTEPGRFALEPADIDEGEVEKRTAAMREAREKSAAFAQAVIDRKTAITEIMSERKAAALAAKVEETPEGAEPRSAWHPFGHVEPGAQPEPEIIS
jgi:hypothetical protein